MVKYLTLLVALLSLGLSAPVAAADSGDGLIEGQIVNGTAGGSSVSDQGVALKTYLNQAELNTAVTGTDAEGRFSFNGLPRASGYTFDVLATFQGIEYQSGPLTFVENEATIATSIVVYDTTTSDDGIVVALEHLIFYFEGDALLVKEYYVFVNSSDRTYIGPGARKDGVLKFTLPAGATDLRNSLEPQNSYINSNDSFVDTVPLKPGNREIGYSFRINQGPDEYLFTKTIDYATARFDLLVHGENIEVNNDQLTSDEPLNIGGVNYTHLFAKGLAAGNNLVIRVSSQKPAGSHESLLIVLIALLVIGAGFASVYLVRKKRLQPAPSDDSLTHRKQQLLNELADLYDNFEDGIASEADYLKLRNEKKAELAEIDAGNKRGVKW